MQQTEGSLSNNEVSGQEKQERTLLYSSAALGQPFKWVFMVNKLSLAGDSCGE